MPNPDPNSLAARIDAQIASLDFAAEFAAQGRSYSELDADGQVVRRHPTAPPPPPDITLE